MEPRDSESEVVVSAHVEGPKCKDFDIEARQGTEAFFHAPILYNMAKNGSELCQEFQPHFEVLKYGGSIWLLARMWGSTSLNITVIEKPAIQNIASDGILPESTPKLLSVNESKPTPTPTPVVTQVNQTWTGAQEGEKKTRLQVIVTVVAVVLLGVILILAFYPCYKKHLCGPDKEVDIIVESEDDKDVIDSVSPEVHDFVIPEFTYSGPWFEYDGLRPPGPDGKGCVLDKKLGVPPTTVLHPDEKSVPFEKNLNVSVEDLQQTNEDDDEFVELLNVSTAFVEECLQAMEELSRSGTC